MVVLFSTEEKMRFFSHQSSGLSFFPQRWLPDAFEFVTEIPKTSVGKFSKKDLRKVFEDYTVP